VNGIYRKPLVILNNFFQSGCHSVSADALMQSFLVGNYYDPSSEFFPSVGTDENAFKDVANKSSPFIDLERNIALFLGYLLHLITKKFGLSINHQQD